MSEMAANVPEDLVTRAMTGDRVAVVQRARSVGARGVGTAVLARVCANAATSSGREASQRR